MAMWPMVVLLAFACRDPWFPFSSASRAARHALCFSSQVAERSFAGRTTRSGAAAGVENAVGQRPAGRSAVPARLAAGREQLGAAMQAVEIFADDRRIEEHLTSLAVRAGILRAGCPWRGRCGSAVTVDTGVDASGRGRPRGKRQALAT